MDKHEQEMFNNDKLFSDFIKIDNIFPYITKDDEYFGMYIADDNEGSIDYSEGVNWIRFRNYETLMLLVENIESIFETKHKKESIDISSYCIKYSHYNDITHECEFKIIVGCYLESPEVRKAETKLEALYIVVFEIIKWYTQKYKNK